jgi:hypothetical protein
MKALFGGCFSFIAGLFVLSLCFQYPWLFWAVLAFFAGAVLLGIRNGRKQLRDNSANQVIRNNPEVAATQSPLGDDAEGDIRHHYNYGGTPMGIDNPGTIQNQSMSFGSDDEDEAER